MEKLERIRKLQQATKSMSFDTRAAIAGNEDNQSTIPTYRKTKTGNVVEMIAKSQSPHSKPGSDPIKDT